MSAQRDKKWSSRSSYKNSRSSSSSSSGSCTDSSCTVCNKSNCSQRSSVTRSLSNSPEHNVSDNITKLAMPFNKMYQDYYSLTDGAGKLEAASVDDRQHNVELLQKTIPPGYNDNYSDLNISMTSNTYQEESTPIPGQAQVQGSVAKEDDPQFELLQKKNAARTKVSQAGDAANEAAMHRELDEQYLAITSQWDVEKNALEEELREVRAVLAEMERKLEIPVVSVRNLAGIERGPIQYPYRSIEFIKSHQLPVNDHNKHLGPLFLQYTCRRDAWATVLQLRSLLQNSNLSAYSDDKKLLNALLVAFCQVSPHLTQGEVLHLPSDDGSSGRCFSITGPTLSQ